MDWHKHYDSLIGRAKHRDLTGYVERHHILPRCMGGSDEPENIVRLTAEEHYVAHQLLVKMHPKHFKLVWALSAMTNSTGRMQRNNKRYAWVRKQFAEMTAERNRTRVVTAEARAKMSAAKKGKTRNPHSEATKQKMRAASLGKRKSASHCASISAVRVGKKLNCSTETRRKKSETMQRVNKTLDRSFTQTAEYRARKSEEMKAVWAKRKLLAQEA